MIEALVLLVGMGVTTLLAYGGLVAAVVFFLARWRPEVPRFLSEALVAVALVVSAWHFSALHHDREQDLRQMRQEAAELSRRALAYKRAMQSAQADALARSKQMQSLQEMQDEYTDALAAGAAVACPADADYIARMQNIRVGSTGGSSSAGN
ncbi:hypothetical protein [Roseibium algae]|uniref:Uncharacterized protein n=1 Tax=Roseibium algae TaxID=3123038 RepID=A0ABU8TL28_9HYPH